MPRNIAPLLLLGLSFSVHAADTPVVDVKPAGKEPTLRVGGLLQAQAEFGDRLDSRWDNGNDRFFLRRARINAQGRFLEEFEFRFEADAAGTLSSTTGLRLQLTDGYIDWKRYKAASVRVGQFKTPFGYEQLYPDPRLLTPERSLPSDRLTFSRQLGLQVGGELLDGRLSYAAGMFNGNGANNSGNDNDQFLYAARVAGILHRGTFAGKDTKLSLGANGFTSHDGAVTVPPEFGFDSTPATPAVDNVFVGQRAGAGLDLQWQIWRFDVWVEALTVEFEPDNGLPASSFDGSGGYVQAGFFIVPSRLQAVLKYDTLDPNDEVEDDDQGTWTAGANLLFKNDDIKLQAHYLRSDVPRGETESKAILRMQVIF